MVDTFSTRRVLTLTSLILIILLATFGSRPSVKRALVSYLSPGRLLRRGRRGSRGPRSAAVLEAASAVEGRAVAAAIGEGAGGGGGGGGGGGAPYDDGLPIPDVVHFVFGLEASFGHIKFGLLHYLAVLGARTRIAPRVIKWHYNYIPEGIWWECARPALTLHKVEDVTHVHGKPKAMRVQHKADVLRMQIMLNEGGMYIVRGLKVLSVCPPRAPALPLPPSPLSSPQDSDVIPLRSFQELRRYPLVMGEEADNGLCNAVMLGQPNTTFINRWWAEYVHFEPDKQWAYHSVILPRQLQAEHPEEVTVLSNKAFFWPLWTQLTAMYDEDDGCVVAPRALGPRKPRRRSRTLAPAHPPSPRTPAATTTTTITRCTCGLPRTPTSSSTCARSASATFSRAAAASSAWRGSCWWTPLPASSCARTRTSRCATFLKTPQAVLSGTGSPRDWKRASVNFTLDPPPSFF